MEHQYQYKRHLEELPSTKNDKYDSSQSSNGKGWGTMTSAVDAIKGESANSDQIENSSNGHYVVKPGDSLWSIAKQFNTTVDELLELNPNFKENPDLIHPGDIVNLPEEDKTLATGEEVQLPGGKLSIIKFSTEFERQFAGIIFKLKFNPEEGGKYSSPSTIRWFQTVETNVADGYPSDFKKSQFVDGERVKGDPDRQVARFWNNADGSFEFEDPPGRKFASDMPPGTAYWYATTSVMGFVDGRLERLITLYWGFEYNTETYEGTEIQLEEIVPGPYHSKKLEELRDKYETK